VKKRRAAVFTRECRWCEKPFVGYRHQVFHQASCRKAWYAAQERKTAKERARLMRVATGRQCRFCKAYDDEVPFYTKACCQACNKTRERHGTCEVHGLPNYHDGCTACPKPHQLEVILLDKQYEREKRLWRRPKDGGVWVAGQHFRIDDVPIVISLHPKRWAKVRR